MIHKAKDLSPEQRVTLEGLLGRAITEHEDISIRALSPSLALPAERRMEIVDSLRAHYARVDAQRQPVSSEEADAIINEALRTTRPNYRPIR